MAGRPEGQARELAGGRTTVLAWSMCALALISGSLVLTLLGTARITSLNLPVLGVASALVGGLVASRRPENLVGWVSSWPAPSSALCRRWPGHTRSTGCS